MLQTRIRIEGRDYVLPPSQDAEAMMQMITSQVRAGGGFVEILRTADHEISVLVSPGMSLSIEVEHLEDEPAASDAAVEQTRLPPTWLDATLDLF